MSVGEDVERVRRLINSMEHNDERTDNAILYRREQTEEEDKPATRWFLVYLQLDCYDWAGARESLIEVVGDIINDVWPRFYLPEALFLAAFAEFGASEAAVCKRLLAMYDASAHRLDRHRRDAAILQLWIDHASQEQFDAAIQGPLKALEAELSATWDSDTFSATPWVLSKVAASLGVRYESPFQTAATMIQQQWAQPGASGFKPSWVDSFTERLVTSGAHGSTVRHRKSHQQACKEEQEHARQTRLMYDNF